MAITNDVLESLRKLLKSPDLLVFADSNWGSQNPHHRELIHAALAKIKTDELQSSISHAPEMGLFVVSQHHLGVDVELTERVKPEVVARICSPEEFNAAPSVSSLWCAKEAAYKALKYFDQPSVISKISVGGWQKIDSHTETFTLTKPSLLNNSTEGRGVVIRFAHHTLAFFIFCS